MSFIKYILAISYNILFRGLPIFLNLLYFFIYNSPPFFTIYQLLPQYSTVSLEHSTVHALAKSYLTVIFATIFSTFPVSCGKNCVEIKVSEIIDTLRLHFYLLFAQQNCLVKLLRFY